MTYNANDLERHKLSSTVIEFCLAACDWPCMRHRLNGLRYKYGLFYGLLL